MSLSESCRRADRAEAAAYVDMFAAAPPELRAAVGLRTEHMAGATLLLAPGLPTPMFNRVIGLGSFEPATESVLEAIVGRYRAGGVRQFWISVSPCAQPSQITAWLEQRGFAPPQRRSWVQMHWGDLPPPAVAATLEIRAAVAEEAAALGAAIAQSFEMPPPMGHWLARLVGRPGWQGFAAHGDGEIAGGGFVHTAGESGWLGMGSILPQYRGRGGQLALMSTRIRYAQACGCRHIHTETGEPVGDEANPSLTNMIRCGFERIAARPNYALTLAT